MSKNKQKKYYIFEMDIAKLNLICIILFIIVLLISSIIYPGDLGKAFYEVNLFLIAFLYIIWIILHELLHSLAYKLYGGDFKKIVYGSYLEKGVLYCLCKQNISRKNILNALMFPLFYLGILTYIIACIFEFPTLLFLSILNIVGSAGDIMMFAYISKLNKDIEFSEFDNPIRFAIYADSDVTKVKHYGLEYIETTNTLDREDLKKVTISKGSYIVVLVLIVCTILSLIL